MPCSAMALARWRGGVAEGGDADAAEQVEVVVAVLVAQMDALAADEEIADCVRRSAAGAFLSAAWISSS